MTRGQSGRWITLSVLGLVVMATWTLVIKFLVPVLFVLSERAAGRSTDGIPIMWDFWWVAHLTLAWMLWRRRPLVWAAGVAIAAAEVVIVVVKFALYLSSPDLSFWRLLWLTNKVYVLAFFLLLLGLLLRPGARAGLEKDHGHSIG